jgi:hypothetical protein
MFFSLLIGQTPIVSQSVMGLNLNNSAALVRASLAQRITAPVSAVADTGWLTWFYKLFLEIFLLGLMTILPAIKRG